MKHDSDWRQVALRANILSKLSLVQFVMDCTQQLVAVGLGMSGEGDLPGVPSQNGMRPNAIYACVQCCSKVYLVQLLRRVVGLWQSGVQQQCRGSLAKRKCESQEHFDYVQRVKVCITYDDVLFAIEVFADLEGVRLMHCDAIRAGRWSTGSGEGAVVT